MQGYIVQGLMLLFMKEHQESDGFSQSQVNTYPIPTHAIGIVAEMASSFAMDRYNRRMSIGFILCGIQIVCSVVLLIQNVSLAGHLTVFYLSSTSYGINPLLYSWSNNILALSADDAARSVIIASMGAADGLLWTFWGIALYPADDAPYWKKGYIAMIVVSVVLSGWFFLVRWVSGPTLVIMDIESNCKQADRREREKYSDSTVALVSSPVLQQSYQATEKRA